MCSGFKTNHMNIFTEGSQVLEKLAAGLDSMKTMIIFLSKDINQSFHTRKGV